MIEVYFSIDDERKWRTQQNGQFHACHIQLHLSYTYHTVRLWQSFHLSVRFPIIVAKLYVFGVLISI